jgi:hypothetical protein
VQAIFLQHTHRLLRHSWRSFDIEALVVAYILAPQDALDRCVFNTQSLEIVARPPRYACQPFRDKSEKVSGSGSFVHSSNPGVLYFIVCLSQNSARTNGRSEDLYRQMLQKIPRRLKRNAAQLTKFSR